MRHVREVHTEPCAVIKAATATACLATYRYEIQVTNDFADPVAEP
jgi:hypothetical protein